MKISVASLSPADKEGYLKKQGDHYKTWKKRWFVLKGKQLVYFEGQKDTEPKGIVDLEPSSIVRDEREKDKKNRLMFSVSTARRVFFIYADVATEMQQWMDAIKANIERLSLSPPASPTSSPLVATAAGGTNVSSRLPQEPPAPNAAPRVRLASAKNYIPYLQEEGSKVLEFWQIWTESVPYASDLLPGMGIEFHVAISADVQKLTWRTAGPQTVFIQKMVDFFWNVGAPESEIDRLNDVGAAINPGKIGSWIDMSAKGGMDGGWYFPVDISLKLAVEAADAGDPTRKLTEWAERNNITSAFSVGRDMGAAPPRQTEIRIQLPGADFTNQLRIAMDAFFAFDFPAIPEEALAVIRSSEGTDPISVSVVTSSEGFVRLGVLLPRPTHEAVAAFCVLAGAQIEDVVRFQGALGAGGPSHVEYQYLMKGFGYSVYKEGFDVMFHYLVGEDRGK